MEPVQVEPPPPPRAAKKSGSLTPVMRNRIKRSASVDGTDKRPISVVIFGATGDLAKKKLYPALYQLLLLNRLPRRAIRVVGFGRRAVDLDAFVKKQCANVEYADKYPKADFVASLSFVGGGAYDRPEGFETLARHLADVEAGEACDRLFFLSVPPTVFGACATHVSNLCRAPRAPAWTRMIIEKPFGRDAESFAALDLETAAAWDESELYRIDHYLGKEVVLNLSTLRFANQVFEPTWNRDHVESVEITFKEDIGTQGRGGYFDNFGIVRDIMQNHLLQVLVLCAMEPPASPSPADVQRAKVDALSAISTLGLDDAFLGQFVEDSSFEEPGYRDDDGVPDDSVTPTFAAVTMAVDTDRWRGVPFLMKAGKGLDERLAEVRVRFKAKPYNALLVDRSAKNELVCRIQPDEALYLKTYTKKPGLGHVVEPTVMDMTYSTAFGDAYLADAYERMFLNAARGDTSLFVSAPELVEAWRIFTPLLHAIDARRPAPTFYPFGCRNPRGFREWSLAHAGVKQRKSFMESLADNADDIGSLRAHFDRHDTDKNGVLNSAEVKALARDLYDGRECPEASLRKFLKTARGFEVTDQITFDDFRYFARCAKAAFKPRPRFQDITCSDK